MRVIVSTFREWMMAVVLEAVLVLFRQGDGRIQSGTRNEGTNGIICSRSTNGAILPSRRRRSRCRRNLDSGSVGQHRGVLADEIFIDDQLFLPFPADVKAAFR